MKTCSKCSQTKDFAEFSTHKLTKDGYVSACKECIKAQKAQYYRKNKVKILRSNSEWIKENKGKHKALVSKWDKENPHKRLAITNSRRAAVKGGNSEMAKEEYSKVQDLYWLAKDLKAVSGEDYHVDHIVPLSKGGEHRLHNLQILHAEDNLRKGAKLL